MLPVLLLGVACTAQTDTATAEPGELSQRREAAAATLAEGPDRAIADIVRAAFGRVPMRFEANQGQTDDRVRFLSRGPGYTLFLAEDEAVMVLRSREDDAADGVSSESRPGSLGDGPRYGVLRMRLVDAQRFPEIRGVRRLAADSNYFHGGDPEAWRTDIPTYAGVEYRQVYPGVDLVYYGNQRRLEHDFVVSPGVDPGVIRIAFDGADMVRIGANGDLIVMTPSGEMSLSKPHIYQKIDGAERVVDGGYVIRSPVGRLPHPVFYRQANDDSAAIHVGFEVAAYDPSVPLVIDPVLTYSTYLGGNDKDIGFDIAVDGEGNAYVTGRTISLNFPTTAGAFDTTCGVGANCDFIDDTFVAKLNPEGSKLIFSTFIGGGGDDADNRGGAIAVDIHGNVYVIGRTTSFDNPNTAEDESFPITSNAYDQTGGGGGEAVFLVKLNEAGSELLYSTYLSGNGQDQAFAMVLDGQGNVYISGETFSSDFPTKSPDAGGAAQPAFGGGADMFVAKIDPTLSGADSLVYSTYLGGKFGEESRGQSIALDVAGNAYVTGFTSSFDNTSTLAVDEGFPTTSGALDSTCGNDALCDGFQDNVVVKLNSTGSQMLYSTYLGGGDNEGNGPNIAVDGSGFILVSGSTSSGDFTTKDPISGTACPGSYLVKLDPSKTGAASLVFSTCGAGNGRIALDADGIVYTGGDRLDISQSQLLGSTPFSGLATLDDSCNVYLTGATTNANLTTTSPLSPFKSSIGASDDAFVQRYGQSGPYAYVSNFDDDTVSVIDTANKDIIQTIAVGNGPKGVAVSPDGTRVYVANSLGDSVSVISTTVTPQSVTTTISVGDGPAGVAVHPDGSKVYVANSSGDTVSVIDTTTDGVVDTILFPATVGPHGVAVLPDGSKVYVSQAFNNAVSAIDTSDTSVSSTVPVGDNPFGLAVHPDGTRVYVANFFPGGASTGNNVKIINTATEQVDKTLAVGVHPFGVAVTPDGSKVYVANQFDGTVSVIDTTTDTVVGSPITVGGDPTGLSVTQDGRILYVADKLDGTVSVIDTSTDLVAATVSVGNAPFALGDFVGPLDKDGDGIWDLVDGRIVGGSFVDDGATSSTSFTNQHRCGVSFGSIADRSDLIVTVESRSGLVVRAGGEGSGTAKISACDISPEIELNNGEFAVIDCGSATVKGGGGSIRVTIAGIAASLPVNATLSLEQIATSQYRFRNLSSVERITITSGAQTVPLEAGSTSVWDTSAAPTPLPGVSALALIGLAAALAVVAIYRTRRRWLGAR